MKKMFKFFMCAAIVAAGFVGCSNEEVVPGGNNSADGTDGGESTSATFNIKFVQTKAPATNMEQGTTGQDVINPTNIRLLIFNANDSLEINEYYDTGATDWDVEMTKTVKLKSGQKKIFVSANETAAIKTIIDGLKDLRSASATSTYADFTAVLQYDLGGNGGKIWNTHTDSLDFVGGTSPTFDITKIMGTSTARSFFLSSAIDASAVKNLKGKIEYDDSRNPPAGQEEAYNNFTIVVQRAVAKGVVFYNSANPSILTTLDGLGALQAASLKYGIDNVNRSVNLFQQFSGTSVASTFYDIPYTAAGWINDGMRARFYPYFYKDYNLSNTMSGGTQSAIPTQAVFFTENTKSWNLNANTTYAAIEAVFTPADGKWISDLSYSTSLNNVTLTVGSSATPGGNIYALKVTNPALEITNSGYTFEDLYLFTTQQAAYKALYLVLHSNLTGWSTSWSPTATELEDIDVYTGGKCYYRLDIGDGVGENIDCIVKRNTQYQMMVTGFKTIGVNDRRKLDDDPWKEKPSDTHVTATIMVKAWEMVNGSGTV